MKKSYTLRRPMVCIFDVTFAFDLYFERVRGRTKSLDFPLGHDMGLELVCKADIWCNRHCASSRARIRAPGGPRTGPEPPNVLFLLDFGGVGGLGGTLFIIHGRYLFGDGPQDFGGRYNPVASPEVGP